MLRQLEITESTWNRWRSSYRGMKAADVRELKDLRVESARLMMLLLRLSWTRFLVPGCPQDRLSECRIYLVDERSPSVALAAGQVRGCVVTRPGEVGLREAVLGEA